MIKLNFHKNYKKKKLITNYIIYCILILNKLKKLILKPIIIIGDILY